MKSKDVYYYNINPVPKPRMTQADRWRKRPCVLRYFDFKDKVRELDIKVDNGDHIIFVLPMAKSWGMKKKREKCRQLHDQRPDKDNLEKALLDAVYDEDCEIADTRVTKIWGYNGEIIIIKGEYTWTEKLFAQLEDMCNKLINK